MPKLPAPSGWTLAEFFDEPVSLGDAQLLHVFEFDQQLSCQLRIMAVALQLRDDLTLSTNVLRAFGYVIFGLCQMAQEDGSVHRQCYQAMSGFPSAHRPEPSARRRRNRLRVGPKYPIMRTDASP